VLSTCRCNGDVLTSQEESDIVDGFEEDHQPFRDSFMEFKSTFESQLQDDLMSLPSDTIELLQSRLQQLHKTLLTPPLPDTPLAVARTRGRSSTMLSSNSELMNLRREVENLRHVQRDSEQLSAQAIDSQVGRHG